MKCRINVQCCDVFAGGDGNVLIQPIGGCNGTKKENDLACKDCLRLAMSGCRPIINSAVCIKFADDQLRYTQLRIWRPKQAHDFALSIKTSEYATHGDVKGEVARIQQRSLEDLAAACQGKLFRQQSNFTSSEEWERFKIVTKTVRDYVNPQTERMSNEREEGASSSICSASRRTR